MPRGVRRANRRAASAQASEHAVARESDKESDEEPFSPRTSPNNVPLRVLRSRAAITEYVLNARNIAANLTPQRANQPEPRHVHAQRRAGRRARAPIRGNPSTILLTREIPCLAFVAWQPPACA